MSEDENSIAIIERDATPNLNKEKKVGLKSRLKKLNQGPTFMKGFAHGFGYNPEQSSQYGEQNLGRQLSNHALEKIKEEAIDPNV